MGDTSPYRRYKVTKRNASAYCTLSGRRPNTSPLPRICSIEECFIFPLPFQCSSSSNALASWRSVVSNPAVNQSYTPASSCRTSLRLGCLHLSAGLMEHRRKVQGQGQAIAVSRLLGQGERFLLRMFNVYPVIRPHFATDETIPPSGPRGRLRISVCGLGGPLYIAKMTSNGYFTSSDSSLLTISHIRSNRPRSFHWMQMKTVITGLWSSSFDNVRATYAIPARCSPIRSGICAPRYTQPAVSVEE